MATKNKKKSSSKPTSTKKVTSPWERLESKRFGDRGTSPMISFDMNRKCVRLNKLALELGGIEVGDRVELLFNLKEKSLWIKPCDTGSKVFSVSGDRNTGLVACSALVNKLRSLDMAVPVSSDGRRLVGIKAGNAKAPSGVVGTFSFM